MASWSPATWGHYDSQISDLYKAHFRVAQRSIMRLMLARLVVLRAIFNVMQESHIEENKTRRLWTYLQVNPSGCLPGFKNKDGNDDYFLHLAEQYQEMNLVDVRHATLSAIHRVMDYIRRDAPTFTDDGSPPRYWIIDDAQEALGKYLPSICFIEPQLVLRQLVDREFLNGSDALTKIVSGSTWALL